MTSFIRTIQKDETEEYVKEILSRKDNFIPLKNRPQNAQPGDYIYLLHNGRIIARAKITALEPTDQYLRIGSAKQPFRAKCLVRYKDSWQKPEVVHELRGFQGIRYLDTLGLKHLDEELWK